MKRKLVAALAFVLCTGAYGAEGGGKFSGYEESMLKLIGDKNYVDAIRVSGDYEMALRGASEAATFSKGTLTLASYHLTFDAPFAADWKADDETGASKEDLQSSGVELVLGRKNAEGTQQMRMIAMDMKAQMRRAGFKDAVTEQQVSEMAKGVSQDLGRVTNESVDAVNGMNFVRMHIAGDGYIADTAAFEHDGEIFFVYVKGDAADTKTPHERIDALINSVKFGEESAETKEKVGAIEGKATLRADDLLPRVREVAELGEYREAVLQLLDVRVELEKRLPGPTVWDDKVVYPEYGITVANPDQDAWKCGASNVGAVRMIQLKDKTSKSEGFVAVLVMDPVLCFGPFVAKDLQPGAKEEASKRMLTRIGEGSLNNIARPILKEGFRQFHGLPAYEGLVEGKDGSFQMKLIAVMGPKATYEIMMYGSPEVIEKYTGVAEEGVAIEGEKK